MALNHREIAAFLSVARSGSVGSAAGQLALTQPAVSRTLKKLEAQLGAPLFVRHATGMTLTAYGRTLLPHAEMLEAEARRAIEEIRLLKGASSGTARIGIVPSVAVDLLPGAIAAVLALSPGIQIQVLEATGGQIAAALLRGEIDFGVAGLPREPIDDRVSVTPLLEDEVCVVARADHPLRRTRPLSVADLRSQTWALPEKGNVIWTEFRMMFHRAGIDTPPVAVSANSVHTLKSILLGTDLVTMLARASFALEERHVLLSPLPCEGGTWRRQLGILRRTSGGLLPAANLLLSALRRSPTSAAAAE